MATGHVEVLKSAFRAVVYAGKDPITGRKSYLKETHPTRDLVVQAKERLVAQVEADRIPDQSATLDHLLRRWLEVADHELSTRETNEGYIRRTLGPAPGDMQLRKLRAGRSAPQRSALGSTPGHIPLAPWLEASQKGPTVRESLTGFGHGFWTDPAGRVAGAGGHPTTDRFGRGRP
jgi:hypothetical protein